MRRITRKHLYVLTLGLVAISAAVVAPVLTEQTQAQVATTLRLDLRALEPLAAGHYEGWAIFGEEKVSTGKFALAGDGSLLTLAGQPIDLFRSVVDLRDADSIVVTIEADGDVDDLPSGIVVLAGPRAGDRAALAFPVDLSAAAGGYILATPTDDDPDNDAAGVWFLDPAGPQPSLTLPALPAGWVYEGWGVTQGTPLSTGPFETPGGGDLAAAFSGSSSGPPFPGEDFVANLPAAIAPPVNLADGDSLIVISVEPDLMGSDPTGSGPFSIKPLVGEVPAGLLDHTLTPLEQNLGSVPTGTATLGGPPRATALPSTGSGGLADGDGGLAPWQIAAFAALGVLALGAIVRLSRARR